LNIPRAIALVAYAWTATGHAAGGHFAADDAAILDPGQCQVEVWRAGADHVGSVWHVGPASGRAVRVRRHADRVGIRDRPTQTLFGPQIKWAAPIDDRLSIGLVAVATWRDVTPRYVGTTLYVPLTVQLAESLHMHVNVGQDWLHDGPGSRTRRGLVRVAGDTCVGAHRRALSPVGRGFRARRHPLATGRRDRLRSERGPRSRRCVDERLGDRCQLGLHRPARSERRALAQSPSRRICRFGTIERR
jgi:hypothetical protein